MLRSDSFWAETLFICLWITISLSTVAEGRRYDKCTTGDGRQGLCVVKHYCREGSQHELLPCERDDENHCCPIPTTQRSAPTLPPSVFERPREEGLFIPETKVKRENGDAPREPNRDGQQNKTPPQEERRHNPQRRPVSQPDEYIRNNPVRQPDEYIINNPVRQPERDSPVRKPETDHTVRQPQPERDVRQPNRDTSFWQHDRDQAVRQPDRETNPARPSNRDHVVRQPERGTPVRQPNRDANRQPNRDRFYPDRGVMGTSLITPSPPRWKIYDKEPERKNRTSEDTSKFPITFPQPYEFSVPRPKVPACGVKPYDLFIAGGQESAEHEWPWMTAIFRRYPDSRPKTFLCGGSLINTKYVLTAAHCFVNNYVILPASSFVVRLGSHFLDSGEEYTVTNLVIHHNHSGSDFFNDIALIRLASEVYITDKIAPICLPSPDMIHQSMVGRLATVAGWGDTAFRYSGTRILQHVTVPIVSGEECFAAYSRVRGAAFLARGSDHVICAGLREGGKDACLGDSGGPLMIRMPDDRWVIVGIVSLGYKCAEPGYPGVYTRVTHYMSWINTNMKTY